MAVVICHLSLRFLLQQQQGLHAGQLKPGRGDYASNGYAFIPRKLGRSSPTILACMIWLVTSEWCGCLYGSVSVPVVWARSTNWMM
jgi:hypothetical protein